MLELLDIVSFIIGILFLHYGSDLLVDNGSLLAKKYNISRMVIGMSLVAFGTSLPEFLVSLLAIFQGKFDLVIGNIVGSNIANIGLVLGASGLFYSIFYNIKKIKLDVLFLIITTASFLAILYYNQFNNIFGFFLIAILCLYIYILVKSDKVKDLADDTSAVDKKLSQLLCLFALGVLGLSIGSYSLIEGSIAIARYFHIPELVIGATAIALGTSLPELVTSLRAAKKNEFELVLGNIFGSNIINIALVFSTALLINDNPPISTNFSLDITVLMLLTLLLITALMIGKFYRFFAIVFLSIYIYYIYIIL